MQLDCVEDDLIDSFPDMGALRSIEVEKFLSFLLKGIDKCHMLL